MCAAGVGSTQSPYTSLRYAKHQHCSTCAAVPQASTPTVRGRSRPWNLLCFTPLPQHTGARQPSSTSTAPRRQRRARPTAPWPQACGGLHPAPRSAQSRPGRHPGGTPTCGEVAHVDALGGARGIRVEQLVARLQLAGPGAVVPHRACAPGAAHAGEGAGVWPPAGGACSSRLCQGAPAAGPTGTPPAAPRAARGLPALARARGLPSPARRLTLQPQDLPVLRLQLLPQRGVLHLLCTQWRRGAASGGGGRAGWQAGWATPPALAEAPPPPRLPRPRRP